MNALSPTTGVECWISQSVSYSIFVLCVDAHAVVHTCDAAQVKSDAQSVASGGADDLDAAAAVAALPFPQASKESEDVSMPVPASDTPQAGPDVTETKRRWVIHAIRHIAKRK